MRTFTTKFIFLIVLLKLCSCSSSDTSTETSSTSTTSFSVVKQDHGPSPAPNTQWFTSYNGAAESHGHYLLSCLDGGYLQIGEATIREQHNKMYIVKTNSEGDLLWEKTFQGGENTYNLGTSSIEVDDGYLISGSLNENSVLIKLNKDTGAVIFKKIYDKGGVDAIEHISSFDQGYILIGYHSAQDPNNSFYTSGKGLLFTVDKQGNELTTSSIDLNMYMSQGYRIERIDNEFVIAGLGPDAQDYKIIKINTEADSILWSKTFGGADSDHLFALDINSSGEIFVSGHTLSDTENWDTFTLKLDTTGQTIWENKTGNPRGYDPHYIHDEAWDIVATQDGGAIVVAGTGDEYDNYSHCNSNNDCSDVWRAYLIKYNASGHVDWQATYYQDGQTDWAGEAISLTQDGGLIIGVDNGHMGFLKLEPFQ
jgi:hypothetical protein